MFMYASIKLIMNINDVLSYQKGIGEIHSTEQQEEKNGHNILTKKTKLLYAPFALSVLDA